MGQTVQTEDGTQIKKTDGWTGGRADTTKCIISLLDKDTWTIIITIQCANLKSVKKIHNLEYR